jgi:hypothetical protein
MPELQITKAQVLAELQLHVGRDNGIHGRDLVARITNQVMHQPALERQVRDFIVELRMDQHRICGYPASGYYMAANQKEFDDTCVFLLERASTTVDQVAAMKGRFAPDLYIEMGVPSPSKKTENRKNV